MVVHGQDMAGELLLKILDTVHTVFQALRHWLTRLYKGARLFLLSHWLRNDNAKRAPGLPRATPVCHVLCANGFLTHRVVSAY